MRTAAQHWTKLSPLLLWRYSLSRSKIKISREFVTFSVNSIARYTNIQKKKQPLKYLGNSMYSCAYFFLNEVASDKIFERACMYPKIQFPKTEIKAHQYFSIWIYNTHEKFFRNSFKKQPICSSTFIIIILQSKTKHLINTLL